MKINNRCNNCGCKDFIVKRITLQNMTFECVDCKELTEIEKNNEKSDQEYCRSKSN